MMPWACADATVRATLAIISADWRAGGFGSPRAPAAGAGQGDVRRVAELAEVEDLADTRVAEGGDGAGLAEEAVRLGFAEGSAERQLDRDGALEGEVLGEEDQAHAALADDADDRVAG